MAVPNGTATRPHDFSKSSTVNMSEMFPCLYQYYGNICAT